MLRSVASVLATAGLVVGSAAATVAVPPADSPLFVYSGSINCSPYGWSGDPAFFTRGAYTETADSDDDALIGDTLQASLFFQPGPNSFTFTQQASSATFSVAGTTTTVSTPQVQVAASGQTKLADAPAYTITAADAGTVVTARIDQWIFSFEDAGPSTCTTTAGDGIVSVYVNKAPDLEDDSDDTTAGQPVTVDVLDNDDVTNDSGSVGPNPTLAQAQLNQDTIRTAVANQVEIDADATDGSCVITADQEITYTPDPGFTGDDSCTYAVTDNDGATTTATLAVTVAAAAPNVPPTAGNLDLETEYETDLAIILGSSTQDEDGDDLTYSTGPVGGIGGTVVCDAPGDPNCTYTPPPGESGTASFDFTVSDGTDTDTGTVTITVAAEAVDDDPDDSTDDDGNGDVAPDDAALPDTGAPVATAALTGLGALVAGMVLLMFGQRRRAKHRA